MSNFIPQNFVAREVWAQVQRRLFIEKQLAEPIEKLRQDLKAKTTIVPQLMELGLTEKHAQNLNARLHHLNLTEEKIKREAPPVIAPEISEEETLRVTVTQEQLDAAKARLEAANGQPGLSTSEKDPAGGSNG